MLISGLNAWRKMVRSLVSRSAARRRLPKHEGGEVVAALEFLEARVLLSAGGLDPTFGADGKVTTDIGISTSDFASTVIAYQADGKILVAGTSQGGQLGPDLSVVRYHADGSLDATFGSDGKVTIDFGGTHDFGTGLTVDSLDRIIVAGHRLQGPTGIDFAVARLTSDGTLDASFGTDGKAFIDFGGTNDLGRVIAVDSQDRVVLAGTSDRGGTTGLDFAVARLTSGGLLDARFDHDGRQTIDFGGPDGDYALGVAVDSQDCVIVSGSTSYDSKIGEADFAIARLTSDGGLDPSFAGGGKQVIDFGSAFDNGFGGVAVDSQDRVILTGQTLAGDQHAFAVLRLTVAGELDTNFDSDGKQTINFGGLGDRAFGVTVDAQDRVLLAGDSNSDFAVARLTVDGALDITFASDGKQTIDFGNTGDQGTVVAVDAQGRVLVAGYSQQGTPTGWDFAVARLTAEGELDSSFDLDGRVTADVGGSTNDTAFDVVAYQSDGKLVVVGSSTNGIGSRMTAVRYHADGTLDTTFGIDGIVTIDFGLGADWGRGVAVDSQDRIVVAGYTFRGGATGWDFAIARLTSDGALDTSFDVDGKATIDFGGTSDFGLSLAVDSLDRIVVAGNTTQAATGADFAVARLTSDGALDTGFDADGKQTIDFGNTGDEAYAVAFDSQGIVVAGYSNQSGSTGADFAVARLTSDGALDIDFDADGRRTVDFGGTADFGFGLAVDSQGRLVVAGHSRQGGGTGADFTIARLTDAGALDLDFDADGRQTVDFGRTDDFGLGAAVDSRDRILLVGYSFQGNTRGWDFASARLAVNGSLDITFTPDGTQTTDFGSTWEFGSAVTIDSRDRILLAGYSSQGVPKGNDFAVARYVMNQPPVADAGGPYTVGEGGVVTLNASGTTDPDAGDTLTYAWDLDGDDLYGETGAAAGRGDETGVNPVFSAAGLDGPTSVTVSLRITDTGGLTSTDTAAIEVTNVAPQNVVISGPTSGVRGQTLHFSGSFTDPGPADTHAQAWQVLDASSVVVGSGSGATFSVLLTETGPYTIHYTVADDDGGTGSDTESLTISVIEMQGNDLAVGGTTANDHIVFEPGANAGEILVTINGVTSGPYIPTGRLLAFGQAGDDHLQAAGSIELSAWLYGDSGHDRLKGGAGHDALFGGTGDDLLVGGGGRDLLVGGTGADRIVGNADDDILIAGRTTLDYDDSTGLLTRDHDTAITAILLEWASTRDYATRIKNLSDGSGSGADRENGSYFLTAGSTVIEDGDKDVLTGCEGYDWFFLDSDLDRATDLDDEVFANDLDFILS